LIIEDRVSSKETLSLTIKTSKPLDLIAGILYSGKERYSKIGFLEYLFDLAFNRGKICLYLEEKQPEL